MVALTQYLILILILIGTYFSYFNIALIEENTDGKFKELI